MPIAPRAPYRALQRVTKLPYRPTTDLLTIATKGMNRTITVGASNVSVFFDYSGAGETHAFDLAERMTASINADGYTTLYYYDPAGNLTKTVVVKTGDSFR